VLINDDASFTSDRPALINHDASFTSVELALVKD
jgi:hypothetical protein